MTERGGFICVHDHSVLAPPPMASSPFVASFHLPGRQYQRHFGLRPQLWSVSPYQFRASTAPVANPESQQHEPTRMGSCQMMHYHPKHGRQQSIQSGRTDERVGLLTVYVIHTTAGAMSKHDIARRQNGPVQKLVLLLVDRRYKDE
jgi:hypothetical protein